MAEPKGDFKVILDTSKTKIEVDEELELVKINGMNYTFNFFNVLGIGGMKQNVPFVIRNRKDGFVTIAECSILSPKRKALVIDIISNGNSLQS